MAGLFFTSQSKLLWNYTDISGCVVVLEPDSMLYDGSNYVYQWSDKSGNNNHFLNPLGVSQPLYVADGGASINNLPVCRFTSAKSLVATFNLIQPCTYFVIYKISSSITTQQYAVHDGKAGGGRHLLYYNAGYIRQYGGGEISYIKAVPYDFILNTEIYNGANSKFYENGVSKATGNAGTLTITGLQLGSIPPTLQYPLIGDIAALIIYNSELSPANRVIVETFMINKYL